MRKSKGILSLLGLCAVLLLLPAWRDMSGNTINPRYVERIKDGQTTKNEITLLFGEPQEIKKTADCLVYTYKSFKDASSLPYDPSKRQPATQSDQIFFVDEDKKIKKVKQHPEGGTILRSTLVIYFKPDGQTVSGHEYTEYKN